VREADDAGVAQQQVEAGHQQDEHQHLGRHRQRLGAGEQEREDAPGRQAAVGQQPIQQTLPLRHSPAACSISSSAGAAGRPGSAQAFVAWASFYNNGGKTEGATKTAVCMTFGAVVGMLSVMLASQRLRGIGAAVAHLPIPACV
jgi:hypothetical protein